MPPDSLLARYSAFVKANPGTANLLESVLRYSGFLAPAQFGERELLVEAGYAASSLAGLLHDGINAPQQQHQQRSTGGHEEGVVATLRTALVVLAHIEVVAEKVAAASGGAVRRRQLITAIEVAKAVMRLTILALTREMLLAGGHHAPGAPPLRGQTIAGRVGSRVLSTVGLGLEDRAENGTGHGPPPAPVMYQGKRCGRKYALPARAQARHGSAPGLRLGANGSAPALNGCSSAQNGSHTDMYGAASCCGLQHAACGGGHGDGAGWMAEEDEDGELERHRRWLHAGRAPAPPPPKAWLLLGEGLHAIRPAAYSAACGRLGEAAWAPWLLSMSVDVASRACTARAVEVRGGRGNGGALTPEQRAELRRRKVQWVLYLLRTPAFELLLGPAATGAAGAFGGVPVLGGLASYALQMLLARRPRGMRALQMLLYAQRYLVAMSMPRVQLDDEGLCSALCWRLAPVQTLPCAPRHRLGAATRRRSAAATVYVASSAMCASALNCVPLATAQHCACFGASVRCSPQRNASAALASPRIGRSEAQVILHHGVRQVWSTRFDLGSGNHPAGHERFPCDSTAARLAAQPSHAALHPSCVLQTRHTTRHGCCVVRFNLRRQRRPRRSYASCNCRAAAHSTLGLEAGAPAIKGVSQP
ncbi:peroxisomal membrane protein-domain-containing protein [Tribonema minus]|uniref:Peroxisomal membrane protein-domain-containing protein n=1 Tax=Tribonema minus TaxID=303371 RepID=A0A835Z8Q5_9STRA|nr:peroxisomal membrane protein-domain-containing protein [Tribonema minus]